MVDTSVVISAFNEEENLEELHGELTGVMKGLGVTYELLFVDDGSTDGTFDLLRKLHQSDEHVRVIRFGRNFGQQAANAAGLKLAKGSIIIIIDADLQMPPSEIPRLREKLLAGHDIVYGVRSRFRAPLYRRVGAKAVNWFIRRTGGLNLPDGATSFVAIDRRLVDEMNLFNERTKYLSGLMAWLSYGRCSSIPVERRPRKHGRSKYTFRRLAELAITLVTHYSNAPLAVASYLGLLLIVGGAVVLICGLMANVAGWPRETGSFNMSVIGTVVLFSGVQLMCIGILGEYIGRIYNEVRDRPNYVIREVLDHRPDEVGGQSDRAEVQDGNVGAEPTA